MRDVIESDGTHLHVDVSNDNAIVVWKSLKRTSADSSLTVYIFGKELHMNMLPFFKMSRISHHELVLAKYVQLICVNVLINGSQMFSRHWHEAS